LTPGATSHAVYLPLGVDWVDFHTGDRYAGGQTIHAETLLNHIPLFVPAGGMIPLGSGRRIDDERADGLRQVHIYPPREEGRSAFTMIEDDGTSLGYQRGEYTAVTVESTTTPDHLALAVTLAQNGFPLPYTSIECVLPPMETRPIRTTGNQTVREDEQGWRHVVVPVPE